MEYFSRRNKLWMDYYPRLGLLVGALKCLMDYFPRINRLWIILDYYPRLGY